MKEECADYRDEVKRIIFFFFEDDGDAWNVHCM